MLNIPHIFTKIPHFSVIENKDRNGGIAKIADNKDWEILLNGENR